MYTRKIISESIKGKLMVVLYKREGNQWTEVSKESFYSCDSAIERYIELSVEHGLNVGIMATSTHDAQMLLKHFQDEMDKYKKMCEEYHVSRQIQAYFGQASEVGSAGILVGFKNERGVFGLSILSD